MDKCKQHTLPDAVFSSDSNPPIYCYNCTRCGYYIEESEGKYLKEKEQKSELGGTMSEIQVFDKAMTEEEAVAHLVSKGAQVILSASSNEPNITKRYVIEPKPECDHITSLADDICGDYVFKYCPECGEKLNLKKDGQKK